MEDEEKDPELEGFVVDDALDDKAPSQESEEESSEVELALSEELQLEYLKIHAEDSMDQNMIQHFERASEFIEKAVQKYLKEDEEYQQLLEAAREEKKKLVSLISST